MDGCGFAKTHSGIDHVYAIRSSRLREWRDATAFTRYHVMRIACSLALASPACGPTYVEPLSEFFFSRRRLAAYAPPPVASASRIRDRIIQRNVPRGAQSEKEKKRRNLVSCMYCTCIYIYIYIYIIASSRTRGKFPLIMLVIQVCQQHSEQELSSYRKAKKTNRHFSICDCHAHPRYKGETNTVA